VVVLLTGKLHADSIRLKINKIIVTRPDIFSPYYIQIDDL